MLRILFVSVLAALPHLLRAQPGPLPKRPNIVVVLMAEQRWDDLGYAGHPFVRTPNIDRLAREGSVFENAFVTTPDFRASQAGFQTGRHARRGRSSADAHPELLASRITFSRLLHESGYRTAYIGRSHLPADALSRAGFELLITLAAQSGYENPALELNGRRHIAEGYMADVLTGRAVEFIQQNHASPFCLVLAHGAVRDIDSANTGAGARRGIVPAERHKELYAAETPPRRPNHGTRENKPALARGANAFAGDDAIRNRLRALTAVDEGIGRMLRGLEETQQLEDTVFIFASDGGYFYGEHGAVGDAQLAYEESIRIPLVVRYPRLIRPGTRLLELVLNIDVAPTVLDLAQATVPPEMQGRSLVPLFSGNDPSRRVSFLIESFSSPAHPEAQSLAYEAVRTLRWKYIRYPELGGAEELYDLTADPYEMTNIAGRESAIYDVRSVRGYLEKLLREAK